MQSQRPKAVMPEVIRPFIDAVAESPSRLAELNRQGRTLVGYFCTYTPIELIHACGMVPVRITGEPGAVEKAYGLAPDFICPFMKRALEKAMDGQYAFLSGLVQGYTCDVACGMVNIWAENIGGNLYRALPMPYNDTPESRDYLTAEYMAFVGQAVAAGGRFSPERLSASLDLYAGIRRRVLKLFALRARGALPLSAADFHAVVQAGFVTPPEAFTAMLDSLPVDDESVCAAVPASGMPVLVTGSLVESTAVLTALEAAGARIVADDLCTGYRHFSPADGAGAEPMDRLVDRYMRRFPCPSRSRAEERLPRILDLAARSGARGVVFLLQKFCTPHLADVPPLTDMLREKGIASLLLEMDETWQVDGRIRTRLEGFFEMLQA
ncbi:MAG: 2-hydroxyacyl-CoA dehydratase family protein [Pseudomonadota bacterium]